MTNPKLKKGDMVQVQVTAKVEEVYESGNLMVEIKGPSFTQYLSVKSHNIVSEQELEERLMKKHGIVND